MSTEIINVKKRFGNFEALKNINLSIEKGEFVAILGPSGCGKTTLLRLIGGFDLPTSGEIKMQGNMVSDGKNCLPPEQRNIGMVFQSFALWPHMTVKKHLLFSLDNHRFVSDEIKANKIKEVEKILEIMGLADLGDRYPSELSGGQKQRVALARAIIVKPSLLLMDEPLSALDAELRIEMRKEIQNLHRITKTAIVYVTHDQGEALAMADKMVIMKDGVIEQIGTPREIYSKPQTQFVAKFVSKANLMRGKWEGSKFHLNHKGRIFTWEDNNISEKIKHENLYPVIPEKFDISLDEKFGIRAKVKNIQYQGMETHYVMDIEYQNVNIYHRGQNEYNVGDIVYINKKSS